MNVKHMVLATTALAMLSGIGLASAEIPEEVILGGVFDLTGEWAEEGTLGRRGTVRGGTTSMHIWKTWEQTGEWI